MSWLKSKSNIAYFHAFGCKAYMLNNNKDNLEKFNAKSNDRIFDDYLTLSKSCRVFNKYTLVIEGSTHI